MVIFQVKILNEINFFLIIIYILLQFKTFLPEISMDNIQNILLLAKWPLKCIAIDYSSIGLKRVTIQLVVNEAWLCVLMRLLRHNTSEVCAVTLKCCDYCSPINSILYIDFSSNIAYVLVW